MPASGYEAARDQASVKINGQALDEEKLKKIRLIVVDSSLHVPDMFELHISELLDTEFDAWIYDLGTEVEIGATSEAGTLVTLMKGDITDIEPQFENNSMSVVLRGYDKAYKLHRGTKTKAWVETKDSDIASQIASSNGLQTDVDATTEVFKQVFQSAQTDFDFLQSRAERIGYIVHTADGKLKFKKPIAPVGGGKTLTYGQTLVSFTPRMSVPSQVSEVTVRGWDPKTKTLISGSASSSAAHPTLGVQSSGTSAASSIGSATRLVTRVPVNSQADATRVAQGVMDRTNEGFIEAEGECTGDPALHAGMTITIAGVGAKFGGDYTLSAVRHEISPGVLKTQFRIEGGKPHMLSSLLDPGKTDTQPWGGIVIGIVTNNNDEEFKQGMVKVKFPWLDDSAEESYWARVAFPGAGKDRGIYFVPEPDDEVLVAFEHGDFNRPYIIGSVYNGKDAPPLPIGQVVVSGAVVKRQIKTRKGHKVTFTETASEEWIEIRDSKDQTWIKFDATNKKVEMHSEGEITIGATQNISMKSDTGNITIEAPSGKIEIKGMQLSAEGQTQAALKSPGGPTNVEGLTLTAKGQSMAEVSASGPLTIRGAIVNIN